MMDVQNLVHLETDPPHRLWTGSGDLVWSGHTWRGSAVLDIGEAEQSSGTPDRRLTIGISGIPIDLRSQFLQDPGPAQVTISWISSTDQGVTWAATPLVMQGRLSGPVMRDGVLVVEIETALGDVDRGRPAYWSHEDQQRRHPGDRGLEYMRDLSGRGIETGWPP